MSSGLMNCPFCGSPAELERDSDHHGEWFNLGCSRHFDAVPDPDKSCPGGRIWYTEELDNEEAAITAWNTRAPSDAALVEALEDVTAHLAAAISLLSRSPKTGAASNKMFDQMLVDYDNSAARGRAALAAAKGQQP